MTVAGTLWLARTLLVILALAVGTPGPAIGQSAFTYQGQLTDSSGVPIGSPLPVNCTFGFSLFALQSGGAQVGNMSTSSVEVRNGVFTAPNVNNANEFGPTAFDGSDRWLQIAVTCPGFSATLPRQRITASPYAIHANSAGDVTCNGCVAASDLASGLSFPPSGTAGGDLTGTYPNPTIKSGAVTSDKIANGTVTVDDVSFNFAAGATKNGSAIGLQCTSPCVESVEIAGNAVSNTQLQDNSVTGAKIVDGQVGTPDIANNAVTAAKLSATGSSSGQVLTSNGSSVGWQTPSAGGGLILPFSGAVSSTNDAFFVTNGGSGVAIHGESVDGYALEARATGSGGGLIARGSGGPNGASAIYAENNSSASPALRVQNNGGAALFTAYSGTLSGTIERFRINYDGTVRITSLAGSGSGQVHLTPDGTLTRSAAGNEAASIDDQGVLVRGGSCATGGSGQHICLYATGTGELYRAVVIGLRGNDPPNRNTSLEERVRDLERELASLRTQIRALAVRSELTKSRSAPSSSYGNRQSPKSRTQQEPPGR